MLPSRLVFASGSLQAAPGLTTTSRLTPLVVGRPSLVRYVTAGRPPLRSRLTRTPLRIKKEAVEDVDEPQNGDKEAQHRRMIDNNNPNPVVSLPGGIMWPFTSSSATDAALTTVIGLGLVFLGGVAYLTWYKWRVLDKMEQAFAKGYDPALELAVHVPKRSANSDGSDSVTYLDSENLRRKEQSRVDEIVNGTETGHYFLLIGAKGVGKSTMILEAMRAIDAEGVSICEAHPDLEVFRLRLGKALNFEYNEDTQTGLFQRRDPREGGPALDIERAFNKLEKVALRCHKKRGKPLVLIINNVHMFPNDDSGKNLLVQIQQRAEAWCESGILTVVLASDDLWPYMTLRKTSNRMQVISISDLDPKASAHALRNMRKNSQWKVNDTEGAVEEAASIVGGRLAYINKVSHGRNMVDTAKQMLAEEKAWLLSQIGLIRDCDDDVMDEQKWSSCSWLLLQEFVKMRKEQEKERDERIAAFQAEHPGQPFIAEPLDLPIIPYHQCRQLMTRTDFMEDLDRLNIITIDTRLGVKPDSMLTLQAAREVVEEDGFDELLESVRERIDEIESLHRTRELTFKDLAEGDKLRLAIDKGS